MGDLLRCRSSRVSVPAALFELPACRRRRSCRQWWPLGPGPVNWTSVHRPHDLWGRSARNRHQRPIGTYTKGGFPASGCRDMIDPIARALPRSDGPAPPEAGLLPRAVLLSCSGGRRSVYPVYARTWERGARAATTRSDNTKGDRKWIVAHAVSAWPVRSEE